MTAYRKSADQRNVLFCPRCASVKRMPRRVRDRELQERARMLSRLEDTRDTIRHRVELLESRVNSLEYELANAKRSLGSAREAHADAERKLAAARGARVATRAGDRLRHEDNAKVIGCWRWLPTSPRIQRCAPIPKHRAASR